MAIFISFGETHISPRAEGQRPDMGRGLIWGMIWKLPYHNLFIIHFSFWQVCLFDIVCEVKRKTVECSEWGDMGFLPVQKSSSPMWPCGMCFCAGKKALSPIWPIITPFAPHKRDMCLKAMVVSHMQNEHTGVWSQDCSKSDGYFSQYLISSPWWRRYEDYNISFYKQWKFRCHCSYEQWHLNLYCLQRGQSCP